MFKRLFSSVSYVVIISLILNIGVLADEGQSAPKDNTKVDNACFRLLSLDAIDAAMLNKGDAEVTRGAGARLILKLLGYDSSFVIDDAESKFVDVSKDYEYKKDIILAADLNLINGYSDNTFKPNEFIKYEDIATILVKALGYVDMAQNNGGYPSGYLAVAAQINLLAGTVVKYGEAVTYNDIFLILNNALDAEIITKTIGSDQYLIKDGQTLFDVKMDELNLIYGKGRLNKNHITSLYADETRFPEDQVMIGEKYFYVGDTNARDMLAHQVEYYAEEDLGGDIATLKNIRIRNNSGSITLKADQIESVTPAAITYDDEEQIDLEKNLNVIYNRKLAENFALENLKIKNGTLEAIDADGNGSYETIFIQEYKVLTIDSVNIDRELIYFKNQKLNDSKFLEFTNAKGYDIKVYDDSEEEYPFEDIKAEDVIEVYASLDGKIVRIYVIENTITGKITGSRNEDNDTYVTIDDAEYKVNPEDVELNEKVNLGTAGVFYVDPENMIVKYAEDIEQTAFQEKFALVQQMNIEASGVSGDVHLRLVECGTYKSMNEDTDEDEILDTRYFEIGNSNVFIYECADTILFNNNKIDKSELKSYLKLDSAYPKDNPVIQYECNAANKIKKIKVAQAYGDKPAMKTLNVRAKLFGGSSDSFIMDSDTKIISVPPELTGGYEEELFLRTSKLEDKKDFEVMAFDVDADTKIARAVVVVTPESAGTSVINSRTKVSVISNISYGINDDEPVYKIAGFTGAAGFSNFTSENVNSIFDHSKVGDLILYSQDYKDRINQVEVVKKFEDLKEYYYLNKEQVETYGKVMNVRTNYVPDSATDLQNLLTIDVSNTDTPYEVRTLFSATTPPPIYVYDTQKDKIYAGSVMDIQPADYVGKENASDVFVLSKSGAVKVILIIDK